MLGLFVPHAAARLVFLFFVYSALLRVGPPVSSPLAAFRPWWG
ncbi:MAG: hypothetical protein QW296_02070 [Pyrobaculum sp.]